MPHQCLACGHLFAEGSSQILQGCPDCKGTRFFYTSKAVGESERRELAEKAQKDLRQVVSDLLQETAPQTAATLAAQAGPDGWANLKAADLRRLVRQAQQERSTLEATGSPASHSNAGGSAGDQPGGLAWENDSVQPVQLKAAIAAGRARVEKEMDDASKVPAKPDTVNVRKPGEYEIDVKALLEREPIVVHKDGSYLIHLPSLFDAAGKR